MHNSTEQRAKRERYKIREAQRKEKLIAEKQKKMEQLQAEIDELR